MLLPDKNQKKGDNNHIFPLPKVLFPIQSVTNMWREKNIYMKRRTGNTTHPLEYAKGINK